MISRLLDSARNLLARLLLSRYLGSTIRHSLSMLAGVLVVTVGLSEELVEQWVLSTEPILIGVVTYVVALLLSFKEKSLRGGRF